MVLSNGIFNKKKLILIEGDFLIAFFFIFA